MVPAAVAAAEPLPRAGWVVTADSQEAVSANTPASNAIDPSPTSIWHTKYSGVPAPLPHTLTITLPASTVVGGLTYLPRPAATGANGRIGQFEIRVSADGVGFGPPVATGTFADDATLKTVRFTPAPVRAVKLTALSEAGGRGPWTSAADVNLLSGVDPPLPRDGWTAVADSQESTRENAPASNAIDGNTTTIWHSKWSAPAAPLPHTLTIDMHAVRTITGLSYLPRPAASGANGRIGQYLVEASLTGTSWGAPVASGTFVDDASAKTVVFPAVSARYVRLTALTEAGARGPWTAVAEVNLLGPDGVPPGNGAAGHWGPPISFPLVPAAASLLPDGSLLTWSAFRTDRFVAGSGQTVTATFNPATGVVTQRTVTNTGHDMFCPGISTLGDGRIVVTGGNDSSKTSIYNPVTDTWTASGPMVTTRGYQATTTLSDGRVFAIGGSWSGGVGGKNGEVYSPTSGAWQALPGAPVAPMLTADAQGVYRADNHGWLFGWSNGQVFQAGPSRAMNWYGTAGTGSTMPAGNRLDDTDAMNGTAVMYDVGKIFTAGGAPSYQDSNATRNAYVIDINGPVSVRKMPPMAFARAYHNSVVLPDGKVLTLGGQPFPVPFSDNGSVLSPELWDPVTETFTTMAAAATPRNYHSVALLLPDGRVFSGGGGLCGTCGTNHFNGEIFTPPNLLNADGTPANRPAITAAPATIAPGATVTVSTDRPVTSFALVRTGTATHSVDTDQRRIPLVPTPVAGGYQLGVPADTGILLPGYYLLFALDAAGVPSVARTVRVG